LRRPAKTSADLEDFLAADALRSNPDVLPYLRLRMADIETRLTDTDPTGDPWLAQLREIAPEMP